MFIKYLLMPLDQHFDGGLGATGDAFESAAEALAKDTNEMGSHIHLPISFLYRHAIELFLKSMIVTLHRALKIPFGDDRKYSDTPHILLQGKWKPLHTIHSDLLPVMSPG